jgi:hypothetical protein
MRVDSATIKLSLDQKPGNFQVTYVGGDKVELKGGPIQVTAKCTVLNGGALPGGAGGMQPAPNPRTAPWKLGFMQARILEVNWAYYRGMRESDGGVLVDNVANQPVKICRDYDRGIGDVWYEGSATVSDCYGVPNPAMPPPWQVVFYFGDNPRHDIFPWHHNATTGAKNYLDEARVSLGFVTTMTELAGPKQFVHHRHFFWSVVWHFKAENGPAALGKGPFKLLPGSGFWISGFKTGAPVAPEYLTVLNDPTLTRDCNEVTQSATPSRQPARDWKRFPMMDAKDKAF